MYLHHSVTRNCSFGIYFQKTKKDKTMQINKLRQTGKDEIKEETHLSFFFFNFFATAIKYAFSFLGKKSRKC